jgi:hypothetical protein
MFVTPTQKNYIADVLRCIFLFHENDLRFSSPSFLVAPSFGCIR